MLKNEIIESDLIFMEKNFYKGYKILKGNTEYINQMMADENYIKSFVVNEYILIQNIDDNSEKEMRFDGEKFIKLRLPPSDYIKGKNALQRCGLDLLNNKNITACAILGGYGSGKSYISMKMGLYGVKEKDWYSRMVLIREALGSGKEVGFLKGDLEDKTNLLFLPLAQQLDGGEIEVDVLKRQGVLESNIFYYLKGTTYNNAVMIVDEAEDLTEDQIKLAGTRIGESGRIVFSGDYKQDEFKRYENNPLVKMCNELRGNPLFGCIYLGEDVRSTTSKMFANLFE